MLALHAGHEYVGGTRGSGIVSSGVGGKWIRGLGLEIGGV